MLNIDVNIINFKIMAGINFASVFFQASKQSVTKSRIKKQIKSNRTNKKSCQVTNININSIQVNI